VGRMTSTGLRLSRRDRHILSAPTPARSWGTMARRDLRLNRGLQKRIADVYVVGRLFCRGIPYSQSSKEGS